MNSLQTKRAFQTGYHGKIPGRGDFVYNRLPREFIDPWDAWLQSAIASSRNCLMDQWLDTYLTSPIWRYYLSPGLCGEHGWAGVMMPSVDKVGRYFPLTTACSLPAEFNPFDLMADQTEWFVEAEELMLSLLDENLPNLSEFDRKVEQLSYHFNKQKNFCYERRQSQGPLGIGPLWRLPLADIDEAMMSCSELSRQMLVGRFSTYSLWWSDGSEKVTPSLLVSAGLPSADSFSALMDGRWAEGAWEEWPSTASAESEHGANRESGLGLDLSIDQLLLSDEEKNRESSPWLSWRSSASSHVGKVRAANEDACLDLPALGLWVVADGMGGHAAGELASGMTIDYLRNLECPDTLNEFVDDVKFRLQSVNQKLLEKAQERAVSTIGCTVVVLMMIGQRAAFLWAGDSRIYLSRDGELSQLTKDHSYEAVVPFGNNDVDADNQFSNIVTRAVGADSELDLDVGYVKLKEGDRFLLCSDGLNKEVADIEIAESMRRDDALGATQQLIDLSLARGARDNVTVVTVQLSTTVETVLQREE